MLDKKYKTDVGIDFYGSSEAEKIKYIWETKKGIWALWPSTDSICLESGENFSVDITFPV